MKMIGNIEFITESYGGKAAFLRYLVDAVRGVGGRYTSYTVMPKEVGRLVFVCKGNICRSAISSVLARNLGGFDVASFGIDTETGKEANKRISEICLEMGVDLSAHRATSMKAFVPRAGDIYFCYEPAHCEILKASGFDSIVLFGGMERPKKYYIHDPYAAHFSYAKYISQYIIRTTTSIVMELQSK